MRQKSGPVKESAEKVVKDIRRATRRHFSAEDKIRIVVEGLRGEESIAELCRREGIVQNLYYRWSKDFLEAGKKRLAGDTARAATSDEVKDLRREASALKEVVAELTLENRLLKKKRDRGWGGRGRDYPAGRAIGPGEMARRAEHGARPWRALSPDDPSKIERWHQTLKNRILLENYYLPGDLELQIEAFVSDYNHLRYHESIANLTPADVYFGRGQTILIERERIKLQTIANRRLLHRRQAA